MKSRDGLSVNRFSALAIFLILILLQFGSGALPAFGEEAAVSPVETDVEYGQAAGEKLLLDVYYPPEKGDLRPALILIHGGGFTGGDKKDMAEKGRRFAGEGYVVFSVNYRLAPKYHYPAALDDVQRAVRWVRANSTRFGVDPNRIGAMGESAGGYFVLMLALQDTRNNDVSELSAFSSKVTCAVDYYGRTNFLADTDKPSFKSPENFMGVSPKENPEFWKEASPITHVSEKASPILIVHGTLDSVVPFDQSMELFGELRSVGANVGLKTVNGADHGWPPDSEVAKLCNQVVDDFLKTHLKP